MLFPVISEEQVSQFRQDGFVRIKQAISPDLLMRICESLDRAEAAPVTDQDITKVTAPNGKEYTVGIARLCLHEEAVFAALMGSPLLLSIAEKICGSDFFPIQEFAVIKNAGDELPVKWHQDVNNRRAGTTFMAGIYLDPANEENGALRVVPGSHKSNKAICELEKMPYETIPMEAGDMLVHDLMIAHSSGTLSSFPRRRVIYFEFMSEAQAREEGIYTDEFIRRRIQLIPAAMAVFRSEFPDQNGFEWKHPDRAHFPEPADPREEIGKIHQFAFRVKPANYCFDFLVHQV